MLLSSSGAFLSMNDEVCERTCQPFDGRQLLESGSAVTLSTRRSRSASAREIPERPARR